MTKREEIKRLIDSLITSEIEIRPIDGNLAYRVALDYREAITLLEQLCEDVVLARDYMATVAKAQRFLEGSDE